MAKGKEQKTVKQQCYPWQELNDILKCMYTMTSGDIHHSCSQFIAER